MKRLNVEAAGRFDAVRHVVRWAAPFVPAAFVVLTVAVHLLNPQLDWVRYTLSDLAQGHFGWVESISDVCLRTMPAGGRPSDCATGCSRTAGCGVPASCW